MSENTVVISEKDGKYQIQNNGIPEFALLGILECIVFEMKTVVIQKLSNGAESSKNKQETAKEVAPERPAPQPITAKSNAPDLRTRVSNAVKAVRNLGGEVQDFDVENAADEQLQEELLALTEQYKRLKNSGGTKK